MMLDDFLIKKIVTCVITPSPTLFEFGRCINMLTRINRAFRRVVENHPEASKCVLLDVGTLLYQPIDCVRQRHKVLQLVHSRGSTHDFYMFLNQLAEYHSILELHVVQKPLLDYEFEALLYCQRWPLMLKRLYIVGDRRGTFVLPSTLRYD